MASRSTKEAFIDACAAVFRLIEHTSFDSYAARKLEAFGCTSPSAATSLVLL